MAKKDISIPDSEVKKWAKVRDHLKTQNKVLRKMLGKLSEDDQLNRSKIQITENSNLIDKK